MSTPWNNNNEPTPITDAFSVEECGVWFGRIGVKLYADINISRNLERRARAAERLLEKAQDMYGLWGISGVTEHLEAAQKEDKEYERKI